MSPRVGRTLFCWLMAALVPCALVRPARADVDGSRSTVAQALFDEARRLVEAGKYDDACPKFAESYSVDPAGGTLLNLADCYEKQGKTAAAWSTFKTAEVVARRAGNAERVSYARSHITALESRLARLTVSVPNQAKTPDIQVTLDDLELGRAAWGVPMPVDPGSHRLRAVAAGKQPFELVIEIPKTPGSHKTVDIPELADAQPGQAGEAGQSRPAAPPPTNTAAPSAQTASKAPSTASVSTSDVTSQPSSTRRTIGFVAAGAGLVGIGIGSYFGLQALSRWDDRNKNCPNGACTEEAKTAGDDANRAATISNIAFGAGIAATAVGVYLVWTSKPKGAEQATRAPLARVSPTWGPHRGGLSIAGVW